MKKKLYLAVCMVVAGTCSLWSSPRHTIVPGFGEYEPQPSIQVQTEKAPTGATLTTKTPPRLVMKEESTHEEDRLIKYTMQNGDNPANIITYGYDQYGFIAKEDFGGAVLNYDYKWAVPGKMWEKRTRTLASSGSVEDETVFTFHPNGMPSSEDYTSSSLSYHIEYDSEGYAVYSIQYDGSNEMLTEKRWSRFTPEGSDSYEWLEDNTQAKTVRTYYTVGDTDNYVIFHREEFDGTEWVKLFDTYYFYNVDGYHCGQWTIRYDGGEAVPDFGTLNDFKVPGDGSYSIISGMYSGGEWNIIKKSEYADSYLNLTDPVGHPDESWKIDYYSQTVDGIRQMLPTYKTTYTYFNGKFVKAVTENLIYGGIPSTSYYLLDPETQILNSITYDENTGNYALATQIDATTTEYSYCDSEGMEFLRLRVVNEDRGFQTWLVLNGDEWEKPAGTLELMDYTCVFDSEGRITSYTMFNDEGQVRFKYEVIYDSNGGFTKNQYTLRNGVLNLNAKLIYDALEDKTVDDSYGYGGSGELRSGRRTVIDHKAKIYDYFTYSSDTGSWEHIGCNILNLEEVLPDGGRVTITRSIDLEHNIVPVSKLVVTPGADVVTTFYLWNADLEEWIPSYKEVRERYPAASFEYHMPVEPTELYREFFEPKYHGVDPNIVSYPESNMIRYDWDADKNDWILAFSVEPISKVEGNTLSIYYSYDGFAEVSSYTVDDSRNVINYKSTIEYPDGRTETQMDTEYVYDSKGHLTRRVRNYGNWKYTEEYFYGPVTIYSDIDDVTAEDSELYTIYNLQGMPLLREATTDALRTLPDGLYIVNGRKMYLRH